MNGHSCRAHGKTQSVHHMLNILFSKLAHWFLGERERSCPCQEKALISVACGSWTSRPWPSDARAFEEGAATRHDSGYRGWECAQWVREECSLLAVSVWQGRLGIGEKGELGPSHWGQVEGLGGFGADDVLSRAGSYRQGRRWGSRQEAVTVAQGAEVRGRMGREYKALWVQNARACLQITQCKPKTPTQLLRKVLISSLQHCGARQALKNDVLFKLTLSRKAFVSLKNSLLI